MNTVQIVRWDSQGTGTVRHRSELKDDSTLAIWLGQPAKEQLFMVKQLLPSDTVASHNLLKGTLGSTQGVVTEATLSTYLCKEHALPSIPSKETPLWPPPLAISQWHGISPLSQPPVLCLGHTSTCLAAGSKGSLEGMPIREPAA